MARVGSAAVALFVLLASLAFVRGQEEKPQPIAPPAAEDAQDAAPPSQPTPPDPASEPAAEGAATEEEGSFVEESSSAVSDSDVVRVFLMDGSILTGQLTPDEIEVETAFGMLSVPVLSLHSLTPGLESHPELAARIEQLIEELGSSKFETREQAQRSLLEMGLVAREALERRAKDSDTERRNRIKALLEELEELATSLEDDPGLDPQGRLSPLAVRDTVETVDFTIVGRVVPQSFSVTSKFGQLTVSLGDIRRMHRDVGGRSDIRRQVTVTSTNMAHRSFKDTGIRVERGDRVTITADGRITMSPWGQQAISTPDGAGNFGWFTQNQIPAGALVGRIGSNGEIVLLGSRASFTADRAGMLQIAIALPVEYADNNQFPGEYKARIQVRPAE